MTTPRIEHLTIKTDQAPETAQRGFWPALPLGLWLPPAACLFLVSAALLALCLAGDQTGGWLQPKQAPLLWAWTTALTVVFLAPHFCYSAETHFKAKLLLQALAVAAPLTGVAWIFESVVLLLDASPGVTSDTAALPGAAGWISWLPGGLAPALAAGLIGAGAWVWHRLWPRAATPLLAAWAGLPCLAWFLSVDVLNRDAAAFPAWLTINPVYGTVLLSRRPADLSAWAIPATLGILLVVAGVGLFWRARKARQAQLDRSTQNQLADPIVSLK